MQKAVDVDDYISRFPPEIAKRLEQVRNVIRKSAPNAEELISYGMPYYKLNGRLIYFAGYKNHIGIYPMASGIAAVKDELDGYTFAKGSIQFPHSKPLPVALLKKILAVRIKEAKAKAK